MSWTDDRISVLKKLWKDGKSAAEIAKELGKGVTRNAVIGKAHRMGLSGRPSPIKKKKGAVAKPKKTAKKIVEKKTEKKETTEAKPKKVVSKKPVRKVTKSANSLLSKVSPPHVIKEEPVPEDGGISLLELTEATCKWPIGDPREPEFTFCGVESPAGTPYCLRHAAMAYQSSSRSKAKIIEEDIEDDEDEDDDLLEDEDDDIIEDEDDEAEASA